MATLYVRDVPAELHHQLKILCAEEQVTVRKKILQLVEKEVAKKRKGKT